ncbi:hypothetical protein [Chitinivibrio alkaliphilus]|uniref:Tetratricopeptide repeat protein n=1 Tax=Chitinivibrio alkaliphilus ACht1 TaxID=1313304 RepID=U7DA04_9BACT|nr:hypothetical protein [Chitinivibrio alkaliphilus]ERP38822.1 hypothetical protein CALK_0594 [Chitinivibrio alkaliphilus ACht1]
MNKKLIRYLVVVLLVLAVGGIIFLVHTQRREQQAQQIIEEAAQLISQAEEMSSQDYSKALHLYNKALSELQTLRRDRYRSTRTTQDLIAGTIPVGSYTLEELQSRILPAIQQRAQAEEDLFSLLLFITDQLSDPYYKGVVSLFLAEAYTNRQSDDRARKHLGNALGYLNELPHAPLRIDLLTSLAVMYHAIDEQEKALKLLERARISLTAMERSLLRERLTLSLLSAYSAMGMETEARALQGDLRDTYLQESAYIEQFRFMAPTFKNLNTAIVRASTITESPYLRFSAFATIVDTLIALDKKEQARSIHGTNIQTNLPRIDTPSQAAPALAKAGMYHTILHGDSRGFFTQAHEIIRSVENRTYRFRSLLSLAEAYHRIGKKTASEQTLAAARDILDSVDREQEDILRTELCHFFTRTKQFNEAFSHALQLKERHGRVKTIAEISLQHILKEKDVTEEISHLLNQVINSL